MIYKKTIFFLCALIAETCMAKILDSEQYTELEANEFKNYFSYEFAGQDGGELLIGFSDKFLQRFSDNDCLVSFSLAVYNKRGSFAEWSQAAGMTLVDLALSDVSKQRLYVAGLGDRVIVKLLYYSKKCKPKTVRSKVNRVLFDINSLKENLRD